MSKRAAGRESTRLQPIKAGALESGCKFCCTAPRRHGKKQCQLVEIEARPVLRKVCSQEDEDRQKKTTEEDEDHENDNRRKMRRLRVDAILCVVLRTNDEVEDES